MKIQWKLVLVAVTLPLLISACDDNDSGASRVFAPGTDFTQFVKNQFNANPETTAPLEINERDFLFNDLDNPNAYDDLLNNP